jgi:hypothetical protein
MQQQKSVSFEDVWNNLNKRSGPQNRCLTCLFSVVMSDHTQVWAPLKPFRLNLSIAECLNHRTFTKLERTLRSKINRFCKSEMCRWLYFRQSVVIQALYTINSYFIQCLSMFAKYAMNRIWLYSLLFFLSIVCKYQVFILWSAKRDLGKVLIRRT